MIRKAGDRSNWMVKMLVYGASDTGKTYTTSRLSEQHKVLILDIEGGALSAPPNLIYCDFEDNKEVFDPTNAEKYPSLMMKISTYGEAEQTLAYLRRNPDRFDIVVLDSITELQRRCADFVKTKGTTVIADLDTLSLQGWGSLSEKFRTMIRGYRDLKSHVVFTALEQCLTDEESGLIRWMPLVEGRKTPFELVGWMEIVAHSTKRERKVTAEGSGKVTAEGSGSKLVTERLFRFHSNGREEAKVRGNLLEDEMPADLVKVFRQLLSQESG